MPRKAEAALPGGGGQGAWAAKTRKKPGKQADARTFGQDLMRGEHQVGGKERPPALGGLIMKPLSSHPRYYEQKSRAEARAGHALTNADFERDHWVEPESQIISGTSIFDPVLCELAYRWFCPPGGVVLDPFAGGSVRGIIASRLGRQYHGVDLSERQIAANRRQASTICTDPQPVWYQGDSVMVDKVVNGIAADFVFSCPPYADLERYSDDPRDLSTLAYAEFLTAYRSIIAAVCSMLRRDRFAAFVIGDVRDKAGNYRGLPWHTVDAFQRAGLALYNQAILVTAAGSLALRTGKQFTASRKLGNTHQYMLVFVKGSAVVATKAIGACQFGDIEGLDAAAFGTEL